jgi:hypothetical protein
MVDPIIKETTKKPKRKKKKDKSKRWSVVFVDDSDDEREEIKNIGKTLLEKQKDQIYSD